jgi:hypothetical protein
MNRHPKALQQGEVPAKTGIDGEVMPPKREIAFKPITRKVECMACGAEADATFHPTCNCNAGFKSKTQKAVEYAEKNPTASVRQIAEETGVGHGTAQEARARVRSPYTSAPESVTGRDGKTYPATKPEPSKLVDDSLTALAEAARHKARIIELMRLMRPLDREQFKLALLEDLRDLERTLNPN